MWERDILNLMIIGLFMKTVSHVQSAKKKLQLNIVKEISASIICNVGPGMRFKIVMDVGMISSATSSTTQPQKASCTNNVAAISNA